MKRDKSNNRNPHLPILHVIGLPENCGVKNCGKLWGQACDIAIQENAERGL